MTNEEIINRPDFMHLWVQRGRDPELGLLIAEKLERDGDLSLAKRVREQCKPGGV